MAALTPGIGAPQGQLPPAMSLVLLALGALVFAGFPASVLFQAMGQARPLAWAEMLACLAIGLAGVMLARASFVQVIAQSCTAWLHALRPPVLWGVLLLGVAVRLVAIVVVAPVPTSDGQAYLDLADGLLARGEYGSLEARAYWPPGMAFVLVPLLAIAPLSVALGFFTLACFVGTALGMYRLGLTLGLAQWASWPLLLLALWPTHVLMSGLPEKELLIIAMLPWVLWAVLESATRWTRGLIAGVLLGFMVLTQPSLQLLPPFAAVLALLSGQPWRRVLGVLATVVFSAGLVIAPWTLRNLAVLDEPVLVSTNGGGNLYRANNELATGGYVAVGRVDVEALPELVANREGKRLAVDWITDHPLDFLRLTAGKVLLFPGDHSYGAYAAFRADPERVPRAVYLSLKLVAAVCWLLLWAVLVAIAWRHWHQRRPLPAGTGLLLLPWLYLAGIHAIFESGSKYHLPTLAAILLLAVLMLGSGSSPPASSRRL